MRWLNGLNAATAFLCQLYLTVVLSLVCWAVFPLVMGWTPTVVISGSMEPRIQTGDIIFADPMNAQELLKTIKQGNVLLADDPAKPEMLVTHRVVEIQDGGQTFITKGDANRTVDSTPVPLLNVHGIEKFRVPYLGIPLQAIHKGDFLPAIIFVASLVISQIIVRKRWHKEKLHAEERSKQAVVETALNKSQLLLRTGVSGIVGLIVIAATLMMSPSAATWTGINENPTSTFIACDVFKKNGNQNTSGSECGNNGN